MLKVYRILNYIVNSLILIILLFTIVEFLLGRTGNFIGLVQFLLGVILVYSVLTSFYFVINTSGISVKGNQKHMDEMLDVTFTGKKNMRFRFDMLTGYSNIILAGALIVYFLYILIFDPPKEFHGDELIGFLILLFCFLYSIVQVYYSVVVLRFIKKSDN